MTESPAAGVRTAPTDRAVVDCDVHVDVPKVDALFPYLPTTGSSTSTSRVFKGADRHPLPAERADHRPARRAARRGGPAGSDLDLLRAAGARPEPGVERRRS